MMKKIINLTQIFCKEYFLNLPILNKNKKNIIFWLLIIFNIFLIFLTQKSISFLGKIGQEKILLEIIFLIMHIVIITESILSCINIYYFSKDIENIISFPIKPLELLIAKFNTLLGIAYITEISFGSVPLIIYGLMTNKHIFYYFWLLIILVVFPIFIILVISIIMLILTKIFNFIKDRNIFQILVTIILLVILGLIQILPLKNIQINSDENNIIDEKIENVTENNVSENQIENINEDKINEKNINNINYEENKTDNKITEMNKYFFIIDPCIKILNEKNNINCIINFIKIIFIEIILFIIFILIGQKLYFKILIKNISKYNYKKINNKNKKNKYKKINKYKKYIIQEIKNLINNPTFLIQCVFPTIIIGIVFGVLVLILFPTLLDMMKFETQLQEIKIKFNIQVTMIILGIMQLIFIFSNISLTSITRKGKNAIFIKYIPIDLYKQFLLLNIPQIIFNNISIIIILGIMKYFIPTINILGLIILFILANLLNIINSLIMIIVDLKRPNLNWTNETMAIKENSNKLFQYILTIIIILLLIYLNKIFYEINFILALILTLIIFIVIILIINLYAKKNIKKLFKKIF